MVQNQGGCAVTLLGLVVLVCFAAAGIVVYAPSQMPTKALPEPKDPALVSRSRELAAWNDSRTWRGCSDYPPPSSVKPVERQ